MRLSPKQAWSLAAGYMILVLSASLYIPWLNAFLEKEHAFGTLLFFSYFLAGLVLLALFYFRFRIREGAAYGMLGGVVILFLGAFSRINAPTDRLHFLEHTLVYVFLYLSLHFNSRGLVLIGRVFLLCLLFAALDEGVQAFFPGRDASFSDFWTNVFSYYLAAGLVSIVHAYRRA